MTYSIFFTDFRSDKIGKDTLELADGLVVLIDGHLVSKGRLQSLSSRKDGKWNSISATILISDLSDREIKTLRDWEIDVVESEVSSDAVTNPATKRQISYLWDLGYKGSTAISKTEASRMIGQLANLTAADVDDFTGPQHTW